MMSLRRGCRLGPTTAERGCPRAIGIVRAVQAGARGEPVAASGRERAPTRSGAAAGRGAAGCHGWTPAALPLARASARVCPEHANSRFCRVFRTIGSTNSTRGRELRRRGKSAFEKGLHGDQVPTIRRPSRRSATARAASNRRRDGFGPLPGGGHVRKGFIENLRSRFEPPLVALLVSFPRPRVPACFRRLGAIRPGTPLSWRRLS